MTEYGDRKTLQAADLRQSLFDIWGREQEFSGDARPHFLANTYFNNVVLVRDAAEPYVIKIPKDTADAEKLCRHETNVHVQLTAASQEQPPPLRVAESIWWSREPAYISLEYLPGKTLGNALETRTEPVGRAEQEQCGQRIGSFVAWMAKQFPVKEWSDRDVPDTPIKAGFQAILQKADPLEAIGLRSTAALVRQLTDLTCHRSEEVRSTPIISHQDLHLNNILTDENSTGIVPTAIIDFGNTGPSHPAYEFRVLPFLGPHAVPAAIEAYQQTAGHKVDIELVHYWTAAHCLSGLYLFLRQGLPTDIHKEYFDLLLPMYDWTELISED